MSGKTYGLSKNATEYMYPLAPQSGQPALAFVLPIASGTSSLLSANSSEMPTISTANLQAAACAFAERAADIIKQEHGMN